MKGVDIIGRRISGNFIAAVIHSFTEEYSAHYFMRRVWYAHRGWLHEAVY
jgi:hypothetical protein